MKVSVCSVARKIDSTLFHTSSLFLFAVTLVLILFNSNASATSIRSVGLGELYEQAELIFHGRCIKNWSERDAQLNRIVTMTTFELIESIKGSAKPLRTIKQIGGSLPGNLTYKVQGVPTFKVGEEYIIFLPKKSKLGFSSPVALSQGKFSILNSVAGKEVSNGRVFTDMLQQVPDQKLTIKAMQMKHSALPQNNDNKASRMELNSFKDMIRTLGQSNSSSQATPGATKK